MGTRSLTDKIRYVLAQDPGTPVDDMTLTVRIWRTFYWAFVDVAQTEAGVTLTFRDDMDANRVPGWDRIIAARRRMLRSHVRPPTRSPTPSREGEPGPWYSRAP